MNNMAMRSQVYEWTNGSATGTSSIRQTVDPIAQTVSGNKKTDIFIGGIGSNITKPAETNATQFVVIEDVATSAHAASAVQVRINTTDYFQNPDVTDQDGVPGLASPYPRGTTSNGAIANTDTALVPVIAGDNVLPSFSLTPEIYVLPGQTYSVLYTSAQTAGVVGGQTTSCTSVACFVKYTLYDGPDSLIANRLLEMGITVNPSNVDWYKRSLLEQQSMPSNGGVA
tara:strand:- start:3761 stop:4441 length:681 start_codon:yes stop_codon:yes gene_type:complete